MRVLGVVIVYVHIFVIQEIFTKVMKILNYGNFVLYSIRLYIDNHIRVPTVTRTGLS